MNEKFYKLPIEKQERIINAGFSVFSKNSYRKSPVQEIAAKVGISKSLLFFYFRNKKDLYLFLWRKAEEITIETLKRSKNKKGKDFFDSMYLSLLSKIEILKIYPDILNFALRVYYEDDPEVKDEISKQIKPYMDLSTNKVLDSFDPAEFKKGIDLNKMYKFIYLASEGYIRQISQGGEMDADKMISGYKEMIDFWKHLFLK